MWKKAIGWFVFNEQCNGDCKTDYASDLLELPLKSAGSNTPRLRINAESNEWEVSYDEGQTWTSLGVKATGADGKDGADGKNGVDGKDGTNGTNGQDGIGVSAVTVDKDGSITVTLTDGSTHRAGSVPVTKEEVQALKITAGAAAGAAGVSLVGLLSAIGYALLKRKKLS